MKKFFIKPDKKIQQNKGHRLMPFKVALALGGGGVRGFAHLGVIKVLKSHQIPIDLVVGTSMGAIIGASFCLNSDVNTLEKKLLDLVNRPPIKRLESFFVQTPEEYQKNFLIQRLLGRIKNLYFWNLRAAKKWLIRTGPIINVLNELFEKKSFFDMQIPFACVSVDLNTASSVIINKGKVLEAIFASCSIPGIFAPFKSGNQLLVDGGILSAVPARQAKILGADFVIGVDSTPAYSPRELLSGLDVMFQADWIKSYYLNKLNLKFCDYIIRPEVTNFSWTAFSKAALCIQKGELATLREIDKIKRNLIKKRRFYPLKRLFSKIKGEVYVD